MGMILSLITSRFTGPLALAGCAVLTFMLVGAKMDAHGLRTKNSEYHRAIFDPVTGWKARLDTCHGNVARLNDAVTSQNAAVEAWKAESARRSAEAAKAVQQAQRATVAANQRAGAILAAKPGADQCASAEALIDGAIQ